MSEAVEPPECPDCGYRHNPRGWCKVRNGGDPAAMTAPGPAGPTDAQAEPFDRDGYDARRAWRRPTTTVVEDRAFEAGWFAAKASPAVRAALDAQEAVRRVEALAEEWARPDHSAGIQRLAAGLRHALAGEPT